MVGGDYLTKWKKENLLRASAQSIIDESLGKTDQLLNYSFNEPWLIRTTEILDVFSKTDTHFSDVSVIIADTVDNTPVFLSFRRYSGSLKDTIAPKKIDFIMQTTIDERDYLEGIFFSNLLKERFSSHDGKYEFFYPYRKDDKVIVLYFSDFQRYGKIGR